MAEAKDAAVEKKREKRTITEIRDSKKTGEKMVYMSVPDYTSAKWAEMAGVDVAVVGDSLAMIAHGHPSTIPATMDMMVMHAQAIRRGAPNTFVLGCMPYQSYNTVDRALTNATRFMQQAGSDAGQKPAGRQEPGAYPQEPGRCRHSDGLAHRAHAAHHRHVRRLQDPGAYGGGRHDRRGAHLAGARARSTRWRARCRGPAWSVTAAARWRWRCRCWSCSSAPAPRRSWTAARGAARATSGCCWRRAATLVPVAVLPDAAWGIGGELRPADYPADWATARSALAAADPPGDLLVLPAGAYRAPEWNHGRTVLDPLGRYLTMDWVSDDTLVVDDVTIPGDDPRIPLVEQALAQPPGARPALLADLGIGAVAVEKDASPPAPEAPAVPGTVVADGATLRVVVLDEDVTVRERPAGWVLALALAWSAYVGCAVVGVALTLVRTARRPRSGRAP